MLSLKETLLGSDDSQPGCPLDSELFKHLNRLAIVWREFDDVSNGCWRRERPTSPSAIIYGDRVTEIIRYRYYEVSWVARLAQGQTKFITLF